MPSRGGANIQAAFSGASNFVPVIGGRGGPQIQAPFAQMMGRFGGGFGGQGYGSLSAMRRRMLGAAPFPGQPGGPPPPIDPGAGRGLPNIQAPLPRQIMGPETGWRQDLNEVGFVPEQISQLRGKRMFPGPERLHEVGETLRSLRGGSYGPAPLNSSGGFGEGYPGDALKRLLMARLGGGAY